MASWPATLPPLPQIPSRFVLPAAVLRTENDIGPAQTRLVTTANVEPWQFSLVLANDTQLTALRTFWTADVVYGSLPFTTSYFGVTRDVRFVSPPAIEELGNSRYRVGMDLEVLPVAPV